MILLKTLLFPAFVALALCMHLGYAWAMLALPLTFGPYRRLLMPLVGLALLLVATAALTTTTALPPPTIIAGLALLALPLNAWVLLRRRPTTNDQRPPTITAHGSRFSVLGSRFSPCHLVTLSSCLLFILAVLPAARAGISAPLGKNWDAADFYVPLGRMLQSVSQRDLARLPRNPLVDVVSEPPVSGRIHAFSYLHAAVSSATQIEPLETFVPLMAFLFALCPLAVFPLGRVVGLARGAALLMTALVALAWLPLWVTYNSFANHLLALPLLWFALAAGIVALREGKGAALATGALAAAALATGYYPAMSAYVLLFLPVAAALGARGQGSGVRDQGSGVRSQEPGARSQETRSQGAKEAEGYRGWSLVSGRWSVVGRLLLLGFLAFALSLPAQYYFFLKDGFLDEALKSGIGYRIDSYIGPADALGLTATLRDQGVTWPVWLVIAGVAVALLLGALALLGRRVPLLAALACGAAVYQALMVWRGYYYGFYKGVTFELPVYAGLIAAGGAALWQMASRPGNQESGVRSQESGVGKQQNPLNASFRTPNAKRKIQNSFTFSPFHLFTFSLLLLLIGLNAATIYRVQSNYSAAGPQLWSADELAATKLHGALPSGASVLVVPPDNRPPTFNSLVSYALLGNPLYGKFSTAYGTLANRPKTAIPDLALLPERADPTSYGFRQSDLDWAGAGMRLYHKPAGLRYHRALGEGGRYPQLAPGASLTLRLGANGIALPKEDRPSKMPAEAQLLLAAASFGPTALTLDAVGSTITYQLAGGLVEFGAPPLKLPATIELRNTGSAPVYLWWGELHDPATAYDLQPRDEAFVQLLPRENTDDHPQVAADIQLHTLALPTGSQRLTGLLTINRKNQRVGQWVFFPTSGALRLDADLQRLSATLTAAGQPVALHGAAQPAGDGDYAATLALANDGAVIYSATLWQWRMRGGVASKVSADSVLFDVLALPRAATTLDAPTGDGALRLRGYTLAQRNAHAGEALDLDLVWQSLQPIGGDLRARVTVCAANGRTLVEQTLPLGATDHGTSTWQIGEVAATTFALPLPGAAASGRATLVLEVLDANGHALAFAGGATSTHIAEVTIE